MAHKCQPKYKCKLRRFQLSVVSSPGVANPGKVPIIPQRNKKGVSISIATWGGGGGEGRAVSRSGTQKMILKSSFQWYSEDPGYNYLICEKYFLKIRIFFLWLIIEEQK